MSDPNKKIFVLIPDGVGLRNFVYNGFADAAIHKGFDVTYWNDTPLDLSAMGLKQIPFDRHGVHLLTTSLKYAKIRVELSESKRRSGDPVYDTYYFKPPLRNYRDRVKSLLASCFIWRYDSAAGLKKLRRYITKVERKTRHYRAVRAVLEREKPALLFCTNQRHLTNVAAIQAARDLGIPTAVFIFSWDNLPKATLFLESDYYIVWSDHMKSELLHYYPEVDPARVLVTGTPQFEPHAHKTRVKPRETFLVDLGLSPDKRYICFSGDDVTTSPHDEVFLRDTARAVRRLNTEGLNTHIIFRRCPVDFSNRYDAVLKDYADVITAVNPDWRNAGMSWAQVLPTDNDLTLQINTIAHCEMVINMGSSMVFDFASFDKPCAYLNYNVASDSHTDWSIEKIYNFVHFRSMPSKNAVIWLDSPETIAPAIKAVLSGQSTHVAHAREWFAKITMQPAGSATSRILGAFDTIIARK